MPAQPFPPPDPLTWHPAYRTNQWNLLAWLEDPRASRTLKLPRPKSFKSWTEPVEPITHQDDAVNATIIELTKFEVCAPAPYVGEPAMYTWTIAVDAAGRAIAGEMRLVHPGHPELDVPLDEIVERQLLTGELPA